MKKKKKLLIVVKIKTKNELSVDILISWSCRIIVFFFCSLVEKIVLMIICSFCVMTNL